MGLYKKGQGTAARAVAYGILAALWAEGCRWLFYLPSPTWTAWSRDRAVLTPAALLTVAALVAGSVGGYRLLVRGRSDREVLRWGGLSGGLILGGLLVKWLIVGLGERKVAALGQSWGSVGVPWGVLVCLGVFAYGAWALFVLVFNHPHRADFLIETETELRKVAWPVRRECFGASAVVIVCVIVVSLYLTVVDRFLTWIVGQVFQLGF